MCRYSYIYIHISCFVCSLRSTSHCFCWCVLTKKTKHNKNNEQILSEKKDDNNNYNNHHLPPKIGTFSFLPPNGAASLRSEAERLNQLLKVPERRRELLKPLGPSECLGIRWVGWLGIGGEDVTGPGGCWMSWGWVVGVLGLVDVGGWLSCWLGWGVMEVANKN